MDDRILAISNRPATSLPDLRRRRRRQRRLPAAGRWPRDPHRSGRRLGNRHRRSGSSRRAHRSLSASLFDPSRRCLLRRRPRGSGREFPWAPQSPPPLRAVQMAFRIGGRVCAQRQPRDVCARIWLFRFHPAEARRSRQSARPKGQLFLPRERPLAYHRARHRLQFRRRADPRAFPSARLRAAGRTHRLAAHSG